MTKPRHRISPSPRHRWNFFALMIPIMVMAAVLLVVAIVLAATPPQLGLFVGSQKQSDVQADGLKLGVEPAVITTYAGGNDSSTFPSWANGPLRMSVAVGAITNTEALTLAGSLVANGQANAYVRIMWEQNQNIAGWFQQWNELAYPNPADYIAKFQAIVTAMRTVPGQNFVFVWNPNTPGNSNRPWNDTYPGDTYVDVIGVDDYDFGGYQSGIQTVLAFAVAHDKPFAIPEWGLNGTDDPAFIDYNYSVIQANNVAYQAYFDYAGSINSLLSDFPKSSAEYNKDFGGSVPSPTTTTSTSPSSTTTTAVSPTTTTTAATTTTTTIQHPVIPTTTTSTVPAFHRHHHGTFTWWTVEDWWWGSLSLI